MARGNNTVEIILSARDQASAAMREAFGGMESSSNKFLGSLLSMKTLAAGALSALGGYIAKTGVDYNSMVENSTVAWNTLLGSQDKAKKMLADISNFAKSTQFGTEDVDTMAKYMYNAGQSGQQLFDSLNKIADVSGAFNIQADDAKELTRQMSQVIQSGTAYTEDLNILQDRGVPIYKALAKEMGTNVAAVKQMASQGKISSDVYMKAFNGVADSVKGASAAQSQTFTGMISTLKDDWDILAGTLSKPLFNALKKGLDELMPLMDGFVSLAKGDMNGFKQSLETTFGKNGADMIMNFANNIKKEFSQIGSVMDKGKQAIEGIFKFFSGDTIQGVSILEKLGISPKLIGHIETYITGIKIDIKTFFDDISKFGQHLFSGKNSIANSFISIFDTIKKIAMPILQDIVKFCGDEFSQIKKWWDQYGGQITEAVKNFFAVLAAIFHALAPVLEFIIKSVWDNIKGIIDGAIKIIQGIILVFTGIFTGNWKTLWEGIKDILGGAIEIIWNAINLLFIAKILKGVGGFFAFIKDLFSGGWEWIVNGVKGFVDDIGTWFGKIVDTGKTKFQDLIDAAKNIPKGISDGIQDGIHWVTDGIMGLANELLKQFKKTLGINSPSKVFYEMGGHILDGLINGLSGGNLLDLGKAVFSDFGGGIFHSLGKIKDYVQWFFNGGGSGILSKIKDVGGFVKGLFSDGGSADGNVSGWIQSALSIVGAPSSWLGPLSTLVQKESGGDPKSINLWDSNAKAGHPSKGLFQTIDSVFSSYSIKGLGDIYNPVANAVAGIRYIMDRYGSVFNVPGIKSMMSGGSYMGYAAGTNNAIAGWHMVGENGPELMYTPGGSVIKNSRDTNKMLGGTSKTYNVTVNALKADMNENDLVRALHRMEVLNNV
jgi:tape measure domain-containing protein